MCLGNESGWLRMESKLKCGRWEIIVLINHGLFVLMSFRKHNFCLRAIVHSFYYVWESFIKCSYAFRHHTTFMWQNHNCHIPNGNFPQCLVLIYKLVNQKNEGKMNPINLNLPQGSLNTITYLHMTFFKCWKMFSSIITFKCQTMFFSIVPKQTLISLLVPRHETVSA